MAPSPVQLKKLARARMERTGESYTTARKAILDGRPERPSARPAPAGKTGPNGKQGSGGGPRAATAPAPAETGDLPEYPAPEDVVQYDAALWHRVLTQAGVLHPLTGRPLSEALLAGLAGGIGFMVFVFEYEQTTTATVITRAHPEPYTENLLARCGAVVLEQKTGSARLAAQYLDAGLDEGRAVVVRVSRSALPWVEGGIADADEPVDVAVLGEHEDSSLLVDDGSGGLQLIDPADLAAARAQRKAGKNWQAWIPEATGPDADTLAARILEAICQTTGRLLGTRELDGIPAHFAKNFGVAGLRTWAGRLLDTTTATGWTRLFTEPGRLAHGLEMTALFLTDGRYGGPGGLRGLYADFLDEAAGLPGLEALGECSAAYRDLAASWDELAEYIDPDVDPEARAGHFAGIAHRATRIADAEEGAARRLARTVEGLEKSSSPRG
ncbi:DUF4872 domain-containing protein [Arthrobacter sp. JSM 101049]|uniref:DUF4872 domain-containing protein n=1 Tax=Arthrobacter sp. JSM 101049 TaxID=929097 RepID=UPI003567F6E4